MTKTICQTCGKLVYTAPGFCILCGEALGPVTVVAPAFVRPRGTTVTSRGATRSEGAEGKAFPSTSNPEGKASAKAPQSHTRILVSVDSVRLTPGEPVYLHNGDYAVLRKAS